MRFLSSLVRSPRSRAVILIAVLCAAVVGTVNLDQRSTRDRATAWATAHPAASGVALAELAAYPTEYRDALVATLPAAEQSRLWQTQLQGVLDRETLTAEQRAFVERVKALATPESFAPGAVHPEVCADVARLFPDPDLRLKVRTLATADAARRGWASTFVSAVERARSAVTVGADNACNCEGWGICECGLDRCEAGNCTPGGSCGCIWKGPCTGTCAALIMNVIKR